MFFLCLLGIGKPWSLCRLLLLYSDCFFIFPSVVSQHELGLATTWNSPCCALPDITSPHFIAQWLAWLLQATSSQKKTLHTIAILQCKIARYDYSRMKHLWLGMMSQLKSRWSHYKVTIMTYLKFAVLDPLSYLSHLSHLPKSHLNHISHRRICPIGPLRASEHHGGWERGWVQEDLQLPLDTQVLGDDGCEILHQLMAGG